jgi:hypothetical protein
VSPLNANNALSLNFIPEGGMNRNDAGTPAMSRRGDHVEKHYNSQNATNRNHMYNKANKDYTTFYMPNG